MKKHAWTLALGLAALVVAGCGDDSTSPTPDPVPEDLFDRFETETLIGNAALEQLTTRVRFFPDDATQALVTHQTGRVTWIDLDGGAGGTPTVLDTFDIPDVNYAPSELGLNDVIFDPDYTTNRYVYFAVSTGDQLWNRVVRLTWNGDAATVTNSLVTILETGRGTPVNPWHGLYSLAFDEAGALFVSIGDATQPDIAQDAMDLNGSLLRIRPLDAGGYEIPADNPYVGDAAVADEIVALGLRSPFRITAWNDIVFVADVGGPHEEIHVYRGEAANFGWPTCNGPCATEGFDDPELSIARDDDTFVDEDPSDFATTQTSIAVGLVYDFDGDDPYDGLLDGKLIFYDIFEGFVRAAPVAADGTMGESTHIMHEEAIGGLALGPDGYVYGVRLWPESVFRVLLKADEE